MQKETWKEKESFWSGTARIGGPPFVPIATFGSVRRAALTMGRIAVGAVLLSMSAAASASAAAPTCHTFPNKIVGANFLPTNPGNKSSAGGCCSACGADPQCVAWTWHTTGHCIFKDNATPSPGSPTGVTSGLHPGPTCTPHQQPSMCPAAAPCPDCGGALCPCNVKQHAPPPPPPAPKPLTPACTPPHDKYLFCDTTLSTAERVEDLLAKIPDASKPNLLTARGGPHGLQVRVQRSFSASSRRFSDNYGLTFRENWQNYSEIGVPAYYWGTNCLHSVGAGCINGHCTHLLHFHPQLSWHFLCVGFAMK